MMKPVFQFRDGSHLHGDAQVVGEKLEAIRKKRAALTPEIVLHDARNIRSVLHEYFEWDDSVAAEKYRLDQAGNLIRAVCVVFEADTPAPEQQVTLAGVEAPPPPPARAVRAFLPITSGDGERSYVGTSEAMNDPEMRRQVLARAHTEMDSVARKWRDLTELAEVFGALDRVAQLLHHTEGQPS